MKPCHSRETNSCDSGQPCGTPRARIVPIRSFTADSRSNCLKSRLCTRSEAARVSCAAQKLPQSLVSTQCYKVRLSVFRGTCNRLVACSISQLFLLDAGVFVKHGVVVRKKWILMHSAESDYRSDWAVSVDVLVRFGGLD